MRNIHYNVPADLACEMMNYITEYQSCVYEYIRTWRRYMFLDDLEKPWAKNAIKICYSELESAWNKVCKTDEKLWFCCQTIGIDNRFKFFHVNRIAIKTNNGYLNNDQIERIIDELGDCEYNENVLSPEEVNTYLRKNNWEKLGRYIR